MRQRLRGKKRGNLLVVIDNGEGTIIALDAGFNKSFESGNFLLRVRPD